jgi:hypothetical protein
MEPDRFDDVAYTVTEEREPLSERSRLRRRVAAVLTAATVAFGGMAAVADALTGNGEAAKPAAAPSLSKDAGGSYRRHGGHLCKKGDRERRGDSSAGLRY